jgi:uncharacterized phiE125 gp8 family phage protein
MAYQLITPPTEFPITRVMAKQHLRIDHEDEDLLIDMLIAAACERWEQSTGFLLMQQTWEYVADVFGTSATDPIIRLHKCPLIALSSISYTNAAAEAATLDLATVSVDNVSSPARVMAKTYWPTVATQLNAVRIRFTAGHTSANNVPRAVMVALMMMIAHMYEHREEASDVSLSAVPNAVETVMNLYSFREHR